MYMFEIDIIVPIGLGGSSTPDLSLVVVVGSCGRLLMDDSVVVVWVGG
jgi:hypothetical protein